MTKTISRKDIKKKFGVKCFPPIRAIVEEMACSNDFMAAQTEAPNYSLIAVSIDSILLDIQTKGGVIQRWSAKNRVRTSGCLQSGITHRPPETLDNNFALEALSFVDAEDEARQLDAPLETGRYWRQSPAVIGSW